jgi:sodium-dependent dicarboxylate transporter 2/3/5
MGRASRDQVVVLVAVVLTVVLWILAPAKWVSALEGTTDATVVMAISLLLFFVPSSEFKGSAILDWKRIAAKIPFDLFLLVGVGGVISNAFVTSGLTVRMGDAMSGLSGTPAPLIALIVMAVAAFSSTFMSDVATANILLPIVHALATRLHLDPLALMLPVTLACSMAFVLPISTPPNAIAVASGFVGTRDFMKHGGFLLTAGLLVIEGVCFTFGLRALGAEGV